MTAPDMTLLPDFLKTRRWFAGKASPVKNITLIDYAVLEADGRSFTLSVVEVTYELGAPERYALPIWMDKGQLRDAMDDGRLAARVLSIIQNSEQVPASTGVLQGELLEGHEAIWSKLPSTPPAKPLDGEQTNTSVTFGNEVILKLIRKLEDGRNPELEMGRFLHQHKFTGTPPLLGALTLKGSGESTLALAHAYVPNAQDGWRFVLDAFRQTGGLSAEFLSQIRQLGELIGEMHLVLASDAEDPAFSPEPLQQEDLQRWSSSIIGELGVTIADAARAHSELEARREALTERARELARLQASGQKTRVHGDLHLGQVLRAGDKWLVFDFEGEPRRSYPQRREKHTPLKDVAGMLRSFSYAEAALSFEGVAPAGRAEAAREAFLNGYWEATAKASFLPSDGDTTRGLLRGLELEKALYELRYELHHRPDWVKIPTQLLMHEGA